MLALSLEHWFWCSSIKSVDENGEQYALKAASFFPPIPLSGKHVSVHERFKREGQNRRRLAGSEERFFFFFLD